MKLQSDTWKFSLGAAVVALLCVGVCGAQDSLEAIDDAELMKLIQQEQYVVVLFSHEDHDEKCEEYETELAAIREDLVDSINAWVVKAVNSPMRPQFSPDPEPAIVFFRAAVPVLYQGPANDEVMLETLLSFKEACIKDLTDASFEHLTQAATGATTGDWLVVFTAEGCAACTSLRARLESLCCRHRGRVNVAIVDKSSHGAVTARRFAVQQVPDFVFFRLGKMYRYTLDKLDVESLSSFVSGWYKNVPGSSIPLPKTPFDDLVQLCADYLQDYPIFCAAIVAFPILLILAFYYLTKSEEPKRPKKKKKKDK